jgi:hypothetical protein
MTKPKAPAPGAKPAEAGYVLAIVNGTRVDLTFHHVRPSTCRQIAMAIYHEAWVKQGAPEA